jgi:hypothetical protein
LPFDTVPVYMTRRDDSVLLNFTFAGTKGQASKPPEILIFSGEEHFSPFYL